MPRYEITIVLRDQTHKKGREEWTTVTRNTADDSTSARRKAIADAQACGYVVSDIKEVKLTASKPR